MVEPSSPFALARSGQGVTVRIRVKPGAAQERIRGIVETIDGPAIELGVTAPPEDGRANEAVVRALARNWELPKSMLAIISGNKGRIKTILVAGEPSEILPRLNAWLSRLPV